MRITNDSHGHQALVIKHPDGTMHAILPGEGLDMKDEVWWNGNAVDISTQLAHLSPKSGTIDQQLSYYWGTVLAPKVKNPDYPGR